MINMKDATGLVKHAINHILIAITDCYKTEGEPGLPFIYKEIYSLVRNTYAFQKTNVTKMVSQ